MRNPIYSIICIITCSFLLVVLSCNKQDTTPKEEALKISTDALNNSTIIGADYRFHITIESAIPGAGVVISVNTVGEADNHNYCPVADIQTTGKTTEIVLNNPPVQQYLICGVRVTSKSSNTNTTTLSFRIIRK
jgi:hypothetical protein